MTRSLYRELAPAGILVNVVMAGLTLTDNVREAVPKAILEHATKTSPLGRLPAPEDVARTIVFVASAANTVLNGEIILASGGHA
jgi:3-oxoacyl-[acyl-carrier protein] reductase